MIPTRLGSACIRRTERQGTSGSARRVRHADPGRGPSHRGPPSNGSSRSCSPRWRWNARRAHRRCDRALGVALRRRSRLLPLREPRTMASRRLPAHLAPTALLELSSFPKELQKPLSKLWLPPIHGDFRVSVRRFRLRKRVQHMIGRFDVSRMTVLSEPGGG